MRNSSDESDKWGKIFDVVSLIEGPYFPKTTLKFKQKQVFFRFNVTNKF